MERKKVEKFVSRSVLLISQSFWWGEKKEQVFLTHTFRTVKEPVSFLCWKKKSSYFYFYNLVWQEERERGGGEEKREWERGKEREKDREDEKCHKEFVINVHPQLSGSFYKNVSFCNKWLFQVLGKINSG